MLALYGMEDSLSSTQGAVVRLELQMLACPRLRPTRPTRPNNLALRTKCRQTFAPFYYPSLPYSARRARMLSQHTYITPIQSSPLSLQCQRLPSPLTKPRISYDCYSSTFSSTKACRSRSEKGYLRCDRGLRCPSGWNTMSKLRPKRNMRSTFHTEQPGRGLWMLHLRRISKGED
jgi:hypothetical protein